MSYAPSVTLVSRQPVYLQRLTELGDILRQVYKYTLYDHRESSSLLSATIHRC